MAKSAREPFVKQGDDNVKSYEGKLFEEGSNKIQVNLVYVDMKQSIPQYYSKNPKIFFDPEKPGAEKSAQIKELMVNQKWAKLQMKKLMRDGVKSAKLFGVCAFKTYFFFQKDPIKDEWSERIVNDEVRTDRIPLKYLLKDPAATSYATSPWIGHEIPALVDDIAKRFGLEKEKKNITVTSSIQGGSEMKEDVKSDFQYGTYYEIEDRRNGKIFYIVEGIDRIVEEKQKNIPYDTMYDVLEYNDIPDRPNTLSDYVFWKDQLIELARYRTMLIQHAKKGTAKYKWLGQKPTEDQIEQVKSSLDSSVIQLESGQDIQPVQHAAVDPSIFQAESAVRQDIQLISKQAPRQIPGQEKTATEVKATEMAAQEVSSENLEKLEEVMASIANKWAKLMEKNYTTKRVIALTEMSDAEFMGYRDSLGGEVFKGNKKRPFLEVSNQDLLGECSARVKAGSTLPDSDASRMNRLQGFGQFVAATGLMPAIDKEELLNEGVDVFDVRNDNLILRKDNPSEESRLLNSGVYISPKISEDHDKHLAIHESESNNNQQNILHILGHKEFKRQIEENQAAQMASQISKMQDPLSGQSFQGMMGATPPMSPQPSGPLTSGVNPAQSPIMGAAPLN